MMQQQLLFSNCFGYLKNEDTSAALHMKKQVWCNIQITGL